jgi:membrane protein DedA with SNARE-associated domain
VAGDLGGYALGRRGAGLRARLAARPRIGPVLAAAEARLRANAAAAVFVSRSVAAPLGPYVNLAAGLAALPVGRFAATAAAGRALWIGGYFAAGWVFGHELAGASALQVAAATAALAAVVMLLWLVRARRRVRRQRSAAVSAASQSRKAASGGQAARASGQTSQ